VEVDWGRDCEREVTELTGEWCEWEFDEWEWEEE
jgi:hypothetical protein